MSDFSVAMLRNVKILPSAIIFCRSYSTGRKESYMGSMAPVVTSQSHTNEDKWFIIAIGFFRYYYYLFVAMICIGWSSFQYVFVP